MSINQEHWTRVVIKVGSSLIAPNIEGCSQRYLLPLVEYVQWCLARQKEVVIVSSGSVAAGASLVQISLSQNQSIVSKQALAAIGQSAVIQHWQSLLKNRCAQLLLTRADIENNLRRLNAKNTLEQLFRMNAIPIVNENDSVVTDELVVGDNDNLAAHVAVLCNADRLIICSDVDGLYSVNPKKVQQSRDEGAVKPIALVKEINSKIFSYASDTDNPIATGGMITKLQAAKRATAEGIETWLVNGKQALTFLDLKHGRCPGTVFAKALDKADCVS